uniref:VPS10 domain-containing receptor SorCS2-like n=1 Tax=Panthera onca TaxID=9690 RepID=UPI002953764A|nr:VPS10 domain-containing receptor SorCS2-like [Panthera onca]
MKRNARTLSCYELEKIRVFFRWISCALGDVLTTKYQVDLGDGFKAVYVNLTSTEEPIRHRYESPGVYRVSVRAENVAGHDEAVLFVQVNSPLQALHLEVLPVVGLNQEVNLTAVLLPLNPNLTVFYWWIGHSLQPLLSLENSVTTRFADTGDVRVTVQAACGNSVLQDSKVVRVLDQFQVVPLRFSMDLDVHNPNTPEWREDVGLVVTRLLSKETSVPEELLVTVVKPGLPTVADLNVLLPPPGPARKRNLTSDKRLLAIQQVLKAQKISFLLRGGVRILVTMRDTDTDSQRLGGGGGYWAVAVLVVIGLFAVGVFILYKFKRQGHPAGRSGRSGVRSGIGQRLSGRILDGLRRGGREARRAPGSERPRSREAGRRPAAHSPTTIVHPHLLSADIPALSHVEGGPAHFTDEEIQAQRGHVVRPGPHSW